MVFPPYMPSDPGNAKGKAGSGVGLIIAHDLMLRNQGMLELRNRAEGGLAAALRLPAI